MEKEDIIELDKISETKVRRISPKRIKVILTDSNILYTTIDDALLNTLDLEPNIHDLAADIMKNNILKPIRLAPTKDKTGKYKYDLIRGKMRFWAWILAYGENTPIPAIINDFPY